MPGNCYTEALPSRLKKYFVILFLLLTRGHFITASTAAVRTRGDFRLGKQGTAVPTLHTCQYVKTYLASNARVDTHRAFCKFQLRCLLKKLVGQHPKPFNDFFKIGYAPPELNITLSWKVMQGFFEYPHKFLLGSF